MTVMTFVADDKQVIEIVLLRVFPSFAEYSTAFSSFVASSYQPMYGVSLANICNAQYTLVGTEHRFQGGNDNKFTFSITEKGWKIEVNFTIQENDLLELIGQIENRNPQVRLTINGKTIASLGAKKTHAA